MKQNQYPTTALKINPLTRLSQPMEYLKNYDSKVKKNQDTSTEDSQDIHIGFDTTCIWSDNFHAPFPMGYSFSSTNVNARKALSKISIERFWPLVAGDLHLI